MLCSQDYLEQSLRKVATETLVLWGGAEGASAGGSKATLGLLRDDLEKVKQELKEDSHTTREEVQRQVQDLKQELTIQAALQEETKQAIEEVQQRMGAMESKMDALLGLLGGSGRAAAGTAGRAGQ